MTRVFAAPREAVFRAFTDEAELVRWWGPEGVDVPELRLDPRPGGTWRICMRTPAGEINCVGGVYREFVRPDRLVMTWTWESESMAGVETLVTLEFYDRGQETELSLTHEGFPRPEARDKHQGGWTGCFASLDRHLAGEAA
jgi:uncharacterized protein YndB with AHSA1/START domain